MVRLDPKWQINRLSRRHQRIPEGQIRIYIFSPERSVGHLGAVFRTLHFTAFVLGGLFGPITDRIALSSREIRTQHASLI